MTRTPELAPPLQTSTPHQQEDVWPPTCDLACNGPIHDGSSVESGFEPGTLWSRRRHLTTKPPRPISSWQLTRRLSRNPKADVVKTECRPTSPCLMPLQQLNRLDGHGTCSQDRTPPHVPVPEAFTAAEPVGWTWDVQSRQNTAPCPHA
ncbi:hypothetical protein AVEN_71966-1 [Araneus ventricosus]|uniref:Uncharacterized protein n=1 Tax=Araneus ventricosus TaxID=182803 RepID=A0A4Y2F533_ARAVE|nr:hypothetical protein AVEN_71966-1 [Araneus ventricosus]